jgi:hypothetical protein
VSFIKVIQVKEQHPFRRAIRTEIRKVRVSTELHHQARMINEGEIGRHGQGSTSVEREG